MKRKFFSSNKICPYGCLYCFSKWENYKNFNPFTVTKLDNNFDIVYPNCDGEFMLDDYKDIINDIYHNTSKYIVTSFSTKGILKESDISYLSIINNELISKNKGFIKVSISITNVTRISEIEPHASSYEDRINSLELLFKYNMPRSVTIKPVLPFIGIEEYYKIINDSSRYCSLFLLGDLYVSESTQFFKNYIKGKYQLVNRRINWLSGNVWKTVEDNDLKYNLKHHISYANCHSFDCETELIYYIKNHYDKERKAY